MNSHERVSKTKAPNQHTHQDSALSPLKNQPGILQLQATIGNQAIQRLLSKRKASEGHSVQRFNEDEHKHIADGDDANPQKVKVVEGYYVTYGEMIALGDYFAGISQLREMAANPGPGAGTREEIEYVRVVKINKQKDKKDNYSESAVKAADKRYYKLAGGNVSHFLNPSVGDEGRSIDEKTPDPLRETRLEWEGLIPRYVQVDVLPSSSVAYRKYHMQGLYEAYFAGAEGRDIDSAMATEAFGAHFLTDSFSAGHLRTKRTDISAHWNARVPMFNYNLKGYMSEKLAELLSKDSRLANVPYFFDLPYKTFSEDMLYEKTLPKVTDILDSKGNLQFGDVVAGAIHDYDNERGVLANVAGTETRLFGDGNLQRGDTEKYASQAVNLGANELTRAWMLGKKKESPLLVIESLLKDGLFAPEQMLPKPKDDSELNEADKSVKWDFDNAEALLADPKFKEAFKTFAHEKAGEFGEAKNELEDDAQKDALQKAVIDPLSDPSRCVSVLTAVINWTPDTGGGIGGHNQDDNAMDYFNAAKAKDALGTLTLKQKKDLIRNLLDGATIGDEEDAIMDILKANMSDARALILEFGWSRLEDDIDDGPGSDFADTFPKSVYGK